MDIVPLRAVPFSLLHTDRNTSARAGVLETSHGLIETPIFMPVGTAASVKGVHQHELDQQLGASIILANTYHVYLRPGIDVISQAGGIHRFANWNKPVLTDSGGYQVYSLSQMRKITEDGVTFRSHIDGSEHLFSPESVIKTQSLIGADIIMAFDECTPYPCAYDYAKESMALTHRWLDRCFAAHASIEPVFGYPQILAPIVQGSIYADLRKASAEYVAKKETPVCAIGGLSVGEPEHALYAMTSTVTDILPVNRARYLMGVGTPRNILECIERGIDMFDCVLPTRNARHGYLYTTEGIINIKNEKWKYDYSPIDPGSPVQTSYACSRAYLRHLIMSKEMLGAQIATLQNLGFYLSLVREARLQILDDNFKSWKEEVLPVIMQRR